MSTEAEAQPTAGPSLAAEGDILRKLEQAKSYKDKGDAAFQEGKVKEALAAYHTSILYLSGLDKNALQRALGKPVPAPPPVDSAAQEKPRTEADELQEKIYSNMSQCHVKTGNWKRVLETADKALSFNPKNRKALFRKAKAYGETGWFEKADKILEDLIKDAESPEKEACEAELKRLREMDKKRDQAHAQKMKGFLKKGELSLGDDE
ncbi:hypothetical protein C8Q77DRAFT_1100764 [Trametes polyzona]|nr:hypothetical protein C8Q77DRAFT_1100764 [Trametes polyzona]